FFAVTPAVVAARDGAARNEASTERNTHMFRMIRWGVLAAAVALVVGAISLRGVWERGGSAAFGQVAGNVKRSTSVSLLIHYTSSHDSVQTREAVKAYVLGDLMRLEIFQNPEQTNGDPQPDKILGADLAKRSGWEIDSGPKTYKTFTLSDAAI